MNRRQPYCPQISQTTAEIIRVDTCDTRRSTPSCAITRGDRAVAPPGHGGRWVPLTYRALAPAGAGSLCGTQTVSSYILHSTFFILHLSYTFSAKEKDVETGLSYFGSRYYSSDLSIWLSVDPMSAKYPSLSPYVYCADNPVKLVDPNGDTVRPAGMEEYEMILNTLPQNDRRYVQLDKNGFIDKDLMNSHQSESGNYNGLCDLVNDDIIYEVFLEDTKFPYVDQNGEPNSQIVSYQNDFQYSIYNGDGSTTTYTIYGEKGNCGLTLFPGRSCPTNSPDNNVKIYINRNLSDSKRAEYFSHEGYGHALLYCLNGRDALRAGHFYGSNESGTNTQLDNMINAAIKETTKNMHQ